MSGIIYQATRTPLVDGDASSQYGTPYRATLVSVETPTGDTAMDDVNDAVRVNIVAGGSSGGGTSMVDDAAFTPGTTEFTPAGGTYRSVRDQVNDNDGGAFAMTINRALLASLETPLGDSAMDDTNDAVRVNIVAGAGSGGTSIQDETAFTEGTTTLTAVGGVFNDSLASDPAAGEAAAVRITSDRAFHVNLRNSTGTEIATVGAPLRVDPTGTTNQPVVGTKSNDAGAPGATNLGVLPAVATTAAPAYTDTRQVALSLDLAGNTRVIAAANSGVDIGDVTINNASGGSAVNIQDGGNSITVDGTVTANGGTGPFPVAGMAAHDAAVSGNPVLTGAEARTTLGTAVTAGDAVRIAADRYGRTYHVNPVYSQASSNGTPIATATNTTAVSAPGASSHLSIWRIQATNAGATATYVSWRSSTTGTLRYSAYLPQGGIISIPLNGGWHLTSNEALVINTTATGSVEWHVDYETVAD